MASVNEQNKAVCSSTLSPRVYQLAQLVYTEFESLRRTYGEAPYSASTYQKCLHDAAVKRLNHVEDEMIASKKEADERIDKLESMLRHHEMLSRTPRHGELFGETCFRVLK
ncbi:hypothetical protein AHF37_10121 [Paragonimus kellicotti]|nr:hypothetical protein AHF37_10121 [Paragonimus kellicotti]